MGAPAPTPFDSSVDAPIAKPSLWSRLYVQFLAVALVLLIFEILLAKVSLVQPLVKDLNKLQEKRLDIYLDLTKLLMTASGVTIGAITGFVLNRDKTVEFSKPQLRKIILTWGLAGVSLYCGYLSIQQVVWMLTVGFFDLYDPHLWLPQPRTVFSASGIHRGLRRLHSRQPEQRGQNQ